jgi:hypothetical protein
LEQIGWLTRQEIPTGAPICRAWYRSYIFHRCTNADGFSPRPNATRIAALIAREVDLAERAQRLDPKLTRRKRVEIECELAVVRRLLEQLQFRRSA